MLTLARKWIIGKAPVLHGEPVPHVPRKMFWDILAILSRLHRKNRQENGFPLNSTSLSSLPLQSKISAGKEPFPISEQAPARDTTAPGIVSLTGLTPSIDAKKIPQDSTLFPGLNLSFSREGNPALSELKNTRKALSQALPLWKVIGDQPPDFFPSRKDVQSPRSEGESERAEKAEGKTAWEETYLPPSSDISRPSVKNSDSLASPFHHHESSFMGERRKPLALSFGGGNSFGAASKPRFSPSPQISQEAPFMLKDDMSAIELSKHLSCGPMEDFIKLL